MMKCYLVMGLHTQADLDLMGRKVELNLSWDKGMIGAMPVFESRELAEKCANGNLIIEIATIEIGE